MVTAIRQLSDGLSRPIVENYIEAEIHRILEDAPQEHRLIELSALQKLVMALLGQIDPAHAVDEMIQARRTYSENDEALASTFNELKNLGNNVSEEISRRMEGRQEIISTLENTINEEDRLFLRRALKRAEDQIFKLRDEQLKILEMQNYLDQIILNMGPPPLPVFPSFENLQQVFENPKSGQAEKDAAMETFQEGLDNIENIIQAGEARMARREELMTERSQLEESLNQLNEREVDDPEARAAIEFQIRTTDQQLSELGSMIIESIRLIILEERLDHLRSGLNDLLQGNQDPPEVPEEIPPIVYDPPPAGDPSPTAGAASVPNYFNLFAATASSLAANNYYSHLSPLASIGTANDSNGMEDYLSPGNLDPLIHRNDSEKATLDGAQNVAKNLAIETGITNNRNLTANTHSTTPLPVTSFDVSLAVDPMRLLVRATDAELFQIIQDPQSWTNPLLIAALQALLKIRPELAANHELYDQIMAALAETKKGIAPSEPPVPSDTI